MYEYNKDYFIYLYNNILACLKSTWRYIHTSRSCIHSIYI